MSKSKTSPPEVSPPTPAPPVAATVRPRKNPSPKRRAGERANAHPTPPIEGIEVLASNGTQRRFSANTLLIREGDTGDTLYVIQSGRVRVFVSDGKEKEVTLGIFFAGDYVGEMALDGGPRSASVETLEPTVCSIVTRDILREHIAIHPDFALEMMARLIRRARRATESVRSLALIGTYGRLAQLLESLSIPHVGGTRILAERITHQAMSNHIACSREMISRLIKDLETGGYLSIYDHRLVIEKPLPLRW